MFLLVVGKIYSDLFRCGFPLRGAISVGDVVVYEMCFAGQPFLDAYKLAQEIDAALCALTRSASHEVVSLCHRLRTSPVSTLFYPNTTESNVGERAAEEARIISTAQATLLECQAPEYRIPRKSGDNEMLCLVTSFLAKDAFPRAGDDIGQLVRDTFSRYGRALTPDAIRKASHTEAMLRYALSQRERDAQEAQPCIQTRGVDGPVDPDTSVVASET